LSFYLHISPRGQLERFKQRLDDPKRHWKISEADYSERKLWPDYIETYEDAIEKTSTRHAPWYVIPSDRKRFRDLAISEILVDTLEDMNLKLSPVEMDIAKIRHKYHAAASRQTRRDHKPPRPSRKKWTGLRRRLNVRAVARKLPPPASAREQPTARSRSLSPSLLGPPPTRFSV